MDGEVTGGGHPTECPPMQGSVLGSISEGTDANHLSLISPPPAPAGQQGLCCDVWSWFRRAIIKREEVKPGPQQKNLDDLGEGPQPGTLEMCAPGIALLAEGAHVRASTNCSCLRALTHI